MGESEDDAPQQEIQRGGSGALNASVVRTVTNIALLVSIIIPIFPALGVRGQENELKTRRQK